MQGGKTLLYIVRTRRKKRYLVAVQTYKQSTYPAFAYRKVLRQELNSPHQRPVSFVSVAPTLGGPSSAKRLYLKGRLPTPRNPIEKYEKKSFEASPAGDATDATTRTSFTKRTEHKVQNVTEEETKYRQFSSLFPF
ncbi:unnamed protein product [Ixodes pacificus]